MVSSTGGVSGFFHDGSLPALGAHVVLSGDVAFDLSFWLVVLLNEEGKGGHVTAGIV